MKNFEKEALSYIDDDRKKHVLGCKKAAIMLAINYGKDINKSKLAALFHDITKNLKINEQLTLCKKYKIKNYNKIIFSNNWKLIHGHTAAEILRNKYDLDNDVYYAVKWHTTGHINMNDIGKILYVADYIEETRNINGIEVLKHKIFNKKLSLDDAVIFGLNLSIIELINNNKIIDSNTILIRNFLLKKRSQINNV